MAELVLRSLHLDGKTSSMTLPHDLGQVNRFNLPIWATSFVVWPIVLLLSVCTLTFRHLRRSKAEAIDEDQPRFIATRIPIFYDILQQIVRAALLSVAVIGCVKDGSSTVSEACAIGYTLALDAFRILVARSRNSRSAVAHHVTLIMLIVGLLAFIQLSPNILLIATQTEASQWLYLKLVASILSLFVAFITPREWTPPRLCFELAHREQAAPSPEQTCSYFSYFVSYGWLTDIILKGAKRRLVIADMLPVPEYDEPLIWRARILDARKRFKTTLKTLAYTLRLNIGAMVLFAAFTAVVEFIAPLGLYRLLSYIQSPSAATIRPWLWVALLFIGPTLRSIAYQQYIFSSTRLVVRTRLCMIQEIYAKAARIFDSEDPGQDSKTSGENDEAMPELLDATGKKKSERSSKSESITNLMAYDVDAIWSSRDFILVCVASPIEVTIGVGFLYFLFGSCSLIALAVMLLSFPTATLLSRTMSGFQREVMKKTDRRVSLISEYLSSIRTIKYLGWEDIMAKNVNTERREEERLTWRRNLTAVAVAVLGDTVPLFALFSMFAVDTLVLGRPLTPSTAFTALSIIETLRLQFVWIANVTRFVSQARIAFGRIDEFMLGEEEIVRHPEGPPAFHNATFRRAQQEDSFRMQLDGKFVVGGLNVIAGSSGSGKSSLLLSLLGETVLEDGSATCPRNVAYSSQTPWLINDTIRANILLHEEFDAKRYDRVVDACGLRPDLEKFERKDLTNVGVNGANLSGGQRQRVCLARAIYSRSELLLLDDVFSALDSMTQKHVWEKCFHEDVLQGRTVILVTQMQAAKDGADLMMELAHGRIMSTTRRGGLRQNLNSPTGIRQIPPRYKRPLETVTALDIDSKPSTHTEGFEAKVDQEIAGQGRNSRVLFWHYMLFFGGTGRAMLAVLLCLLSQLAFFAIPLWLSVWVGASSREDAKTVGFYVAIYGAWLLSFTTISAISQTYLQWGARKAAHTLHEKLVTAAMWVSVHWYDKNPPGRLINRFSSDTYSLDTVLVEYLRIAIDNIFRFVLRLTAIGSIMPVFAVPAAFICTIGLVCAEMYTRAQLSVKALTSASQSPIFSFFGESLSGKAVIRSCSGMQEAFADDLARRLRVYARAGETQYNLNRWICVRADGCAAVIALFTGVIALSMGSNAPAGRLGFSLTSAIGLGQTILTMVRNMNELEAELNCFHRVREYASLPLETDSAKDQEDATTPDLPEPWPSQGQVEFRGVTAKYALDGPDILQDVSLTIKPGERVAIIGRTGSGKSTLALSLLGFTNVTKGAVLVDGVDISTIPLRVLRRRLTIIPQEPVLFGSDVRFNLDPSQTAPDEHLAEAIDACSVVESLGAPRASENASSQELGGNSNSSAIALNLDTPVAPRGSNFSTGQRQVLSLARATVRRSKVVVLDEATASLDHVSDAAIQQVLRSAFRGKTIFAIVHRLSTVMDYDRIVVMDSGKVREIGPQLELYRDQGIFYSMVRQSIEHGKGGEWTPEKLESLKARSAGSSRQMRTP
ncbi:ABC multidrug transporter [Hypoxylon rubiginosum]|uniref:ABC multidrug transporter n=1 Tax=Hypoxylon rubiginosum TaxID=110542 RepID=A0ACB9YLZ5_9PEZI|nr:ABC multidrug transporter [Hypoxylon rubiginosum]